MDFDMTEQTNKTQYEAPRLTEFGSVRNLTGGSFSAGNDGSGNMTGLLM
jgi:hypothetical protein